MARNPKDLVVAYYQFHRSLRTMSYRGTFQEFCRRFMNDKRECVSLHSRPARPVLVLHPQPLHAGLLPRFQAGLLGLRGDGSWSEVIAHTQQGRRSAQKPCSLTCCWGPEKFPT